MLCNEVFAPIGVGTYTRLTHLKKTIQALKNNTGAGQSDLYVFSDSAKLGDEEKVAKVRRYLQSITGFKSVNIVERKSNNRVLNNRGGMELLLKKHRKMIFMEDDVVTMPGFLQFMNKALNYYKNDPRIISISGYSPILSDDISDVYFTQRFNGWGFATWREKFNPFDFSITGFEKNKTKLEFIKKIDTIGKDVLIMLELVSIGAIDALDAKIMLYQINNNLTTVYPKKTLVHNIGFDGSGVHCGVADNINIQPWKKSENFFLKKFNGKHNKKEFKKYYGVSLTMSFYRLLICLDWYESLRIVKRKLIK